MDQPIKLKHVLIVLGIVAFLVFSVWHSNQPGVETDYGNDCWDPRLGHEPC